MAALNIPPPPEGFTLDGIPPPPMGFTLDGANPSEASGFARTAGLTARSAVNALTGLPAMVGDAANYIANLGIGGVNSVAGTQIPKYEMLSAATSRSMDEMGLPKPKTLDEKIADVGMSALGGAGAANIGARAAANIPKLAPYLKFLGDAPLVQAIGAIAGTMTTEGARKAGVSNPLALGVLGTLGGVGAGGIGTAAARVGAGSAQALKPFTQSGREVIVGRALNRVAQTPTATAERMATAEPLIPGSQPTVSQVSRDPGLIGAESAIRGMDERNLIGGRLSEQNAARQTELGRIAGNEETLARAQTKRDRTFAERAEPAFANSQPLNLGREWINNPILRRIQALREEPGNAGQTTRSALDEAQALISQADVDITNPRALYAIRKDIALIRDGELTGVGINGTERGNMRHARGQLQQVIGAIDNAIETGAPGYRDYMSLYAKRSIPLEDIQALQSLRERAVLAAPDPVTGAPVLSQAKFQNLLRANVAPNPNYGGRGPGAATLSGNVLNQQGKNERVLGRLSPQQLSVLDRVAADLDRGTAAQASTMKSPGSDTFKNMSVAAVIGRVLGDETGQIVMETSGAKSLARPFSFLYRVPDQEIQHLMLESWLDPRLASRLMRRATEHETAAVADILKQRAAKQAAAASIYSGGNQ